METPGTQTATELRVLALVASVGGLEAVSMVLESLPPELNAAVLVLIHQQPDRPGHLVEILAQRSALPVLAATHGAALRAGEVVVAPAGAHLLVTPGPCTALIPSGAAPPSRPSADLLLTSMAIAVGSRATAAVLSGGGHDGATGATAIHVFGGTVLATDEASSAAFSMPQATINRDHVIDHVVALQDVAELLTALVSAG